MGSTNSKKTRRVEKNTVLPFSNQNPNIQSRQNLSKFQDETSKTASTTEMVKQIEKQNIPSNIKHSLFKDKEKVINLISTDRNSSSQEQMKEFPSFKNKQDSCDSIDSQKQDGKVNKKLGIKKIQQTQDNKEIEGNQQQSSILSPNQSQIIDISNSHKNLSFNGTQNNFSKLIQIKEKNNSSLSQQKGEDPMANTPTKLEIATSHDCCKVKFDLLDLVSNSKFLPNIQNQPSFLTQTQSQFEKKQKVGVTKSAPSSPNQQSYQEQQRRKFNERKERQSTQVSTGEAGQNNNARGTFLDGSSLDLFIPSPHEKNQELILLSQRKMREIEDNIKIDTDLISVLQDSLKWQRPALSVMIPQMKDKLSPYFPSKKLSSQQFFDDDYNISPISRNASNADVQNIFQDFNVFQEKSIKKNDINSNAIPYVNEQPILRTETSISSDIQSNNYSISSQFPSHINSFHNLDSRQSLNSKAFSINSTEANKDNTQSNQQNGLHLCEENVAMHSIKKQLKRQPSVRFQVSPVNLEKIREIDEKDEDGATKQGEQPSMKQESSKVIQNQNANNLKQTDKPSNLFPFKRKNQRLSSLNYSKRDPLVKVGGIFKRQQTQKLSITPNTLSPQYTPTSSMFMYESSRCGVSPTSPLSQTSLSQSEDEVEGEEQVANSEESCDSMRKSEFRQSINSNRFSHRTSIFFEENVKLIEDEKKEKGIGSEYSVKVESTQKQESEKLFQTKTDLNINEKSLGLNQNISIEQENIQVDSTIQNSLNLGTLIKNGDSFNIPFNQQCDSLSLDSNSNFHEKDERSLDSILFKSQSLQIEKNNNENQKSLFSKILNNSMTTSQLMIPELGKKHSFQQINNSVLSNNSYVTFYHKNPDSSVIETSSVKKEVDNQGHKKINEYTLLQELGRGGFGKVKLASIISTETAEQVVTYLAVKISNKKKLKQKLISMKVNAYSLLQREVAIMKKIDHPHLVKLFEVIDDPDDNKIYMIMEYMQKGSIMSHTYWRKELQQTNPSLYEKAFSEEISKKKRNDLLPKKLPLDKCRKYFQQFTLGIDYMHNQAQIIHRDIKPENILINEEDNLKIGDFGVSHIMESSGDKEMKDNAGTKAFTGPEGWSREFKGKPLDIWAAGVTLFYMAYGELPFFSKDQNVLKDQIQNAEPKIPSDSDPLLKDLVIKLLKKNPDERITAKEMLEHPWLTQDGTITLKNSEIGEMKISDSELQGAFTMKIKLGTLMKLKVKMNRSLSKARTFLKSSININNGGFLKMEDKTGDFRRKSCFNN